MSSLTDDVNFRTYCALDALSTRHCKPSLVSDMKEYGVYDFYHRIVHPLTKIVSGMNRRGVWVDQSARVAATTDLEIRIKERQEELNSIAGRELNIAGDDLRTFLYDEVGLPYPFRRPWETKRSTNKETLLALKEHVPEVALMLDGIIELRQLTTFVNTFLIVGDDVDDNGRVHPQFRLGPVTGRLSCKKPDFHNVPDGIPRSIYSASPGKILIGADYSQVEFRIFAILGHCLALLEGFARGEDAHTMNTKIIMGRSDIEVHKLFKKIRTVIKRFSFGMIYGGKLQTLVTAVREAFNLLGEHVSEVQVHAAVERFFTLNPQAQEFMTQCRIGTLETRLMYNRFGRLRIFFGPKRDVPGEAGNYPMQSGAGDVINTRMLKIDPVIPESILIQVHDSLILEVDEEEGEEKKAQVKELMEEPIPEFDGYQFPVSIKLGKNWAEV